MLIQRAPDVYEKLRHLGGMATDDILAPAERPGGARLSDGWQGVGPRGGVTPHAGVYRAAMPNGKRISLMRVMFTDHCIMDCHYCPNSHWVPRRRYGFKVDELARLFDEMHSRHTVDGLFLSSGIFKDPNTTQERLINVVEAIRTRYKFQGYIHLKVMPGTSDHALIEASQRLGARLSINMESPSREHLESVSKMKDFDNGILAPMQRISELMQETYGGAVGQATQLVVGAANESDWDIYSRMRNLYGDPRVQARLLLGIPPVKYTPLEEHPATPPVREHRLYQLDWLSRIYGYDIDERPVLRYGRFPQPAGRPQTDGRGEQPRPLPRRCEPGGRARPSPRSRHWADGCGSHRNAAPRAFHHAAAGTAGDGRRAETRPALPAFPRTQASAGQAGRAAALRGAVLGCARRIVRPFVWKSERAPRRARCNGLRIVSAQPGQLRHACAMSWRARMRGMIPFQGIREA